MEHGRGSARRPSLYAAIELARVILKVRERLKAKVAQRSAIPRCGSFADLSLGSFTKFAIHNQQLSVLAMTDGVVS